MSGIKKTIHIEIPDEVSDEQVEMYLRMIIESSSDLPNIYTHTGACEESDHCAGPGSLIEREILARQSEPEIPPTPLTIDERFASERRWDARVKAAKERNQ